LLFIILIFIIIIINDNPFIIITIYIIIYFIIHYLLFIYLLFIYLLIYLFIYLFIIYLFIHLIIFNWRNVPLPLLPGKIHKCQKYGNLQFSRVYLPGHMKTCTQILVIPF